MEWDHASPGRMQVSLPGDCGTKMTLLDARGWQHKSSSKSTGPFAWWAGLCDERMVRCRSTVPPTCERHADPLHLIRCRCPKTIAVPAVSVPGGAWWLDLGWLPILTPRNPYLAFTLKNQRLMTPEATLNTERTAPRQELPATRTRRLSFLADVSTESTARHLGAIFDVSSRTPTPSSLAKASFKILLSVFSHWESSPGTIVGHGGDVVSWADSLLRASSGGGSVRRHNCLLGLNLRRKSVPLRLQSVDHLLETRNLCSPIWWLNWCCCWRLDFRSFWRRCLPSSNCFTNMIRSS